MAEKSLNNIFNKFDKAKSDVKLLSDDEIQKKITDGVEMSKRVHGIEVMTYDMKKDKKVLCGHLKGDTFYREVKPEHLMHKFNSYAIQEDAFHYLVINGCKRVVLQTQDGYLVSTIEDWLQPNIKVMNYGHGSQRFLPVKYMSFSRNIDV